MFVAGLVVVLLLGSAVGAAWFLAPLSEGEAGDRAMLAMRGMAAEFADSGDGDLRRMTMDLEMGAMDDGIGGKLQATLVTEWGRNQVMRTTYDAASGPMTYSLEAYCTEEIQVILFGDTSFEARAETVPGSDAFPECMGYLAEEMDSGLTLEEFEDLELVEVDSHWGGSVTAVFVDEFDMQYTAHVDSKGRVTQLDLQDEEMLISTQLEYGARETIVLPSADHRFPAMVDGWGDWENEEFRWEGWSWQDPSAMAEEGFGMGGPMGDHATYPLDEFEVRVIGPDEEIKVAFPLDAGAEQEGAGFTFLFEDDGDGRFGPADAFTVTALDGQEVDHEVVVWDLWADREMGDDSMMDAPGPGVLALLVLLIAVGAVARRVRRG